MEEKEEKLQKEAKMCRTHKAECRYFEHVKNKTNT